MSGSRDTSGRRRPNTKKRFAHLMKRSPDHKGGHLPSALPPFFGIVVRQNYPATDPAKPLL